MHVSWVSSSIEIYVVQGERLLTTVDILWYINTSNISMSFVKYEHSATYNHDL